MDDQERAILTAILTRQSVLSLAVTIEGAPSVGQLPFAIQPDFGALLVHVSSLARHARGLGEGARFAALVQAPKADELDPFQRPRVRLEGSARALARGSQDWEEARNRYLDKLPTGAVTFGLGDFTLYELEVEGGRFVSGFAGAHTLNPRILAELAAGST